MKEQTILHLMVKSSLLYVIRNRSYSRLKNVPLRENCQFWVIQTEETKHIENKSLNGEFHRYTLFFMDKSYIFVCFLTHFLFIINTVIRGAHDN